MTGLLDALGWPGPVIPPCRGECRAMAQDGRSAVQQDALTPKGRVPVCSCCLLLLRQGTDDEVTLAKSAQNLEASIDDLTRVRLWVCDSCGYDLVRLVAK